MTLRYLKIFITVCECGTMRKAAEILHIAQPAISNTVSELEKYYDIVLFDRINQRPLWKQKLPERKLLEQKNTARPEDLTVSHIHIKLQVSCLTHQLDKLEFICVYTSRFLGQHHYTHTHTQE